MTLRDFNRGLDDAAQGVQYPDPRETVDYLEGYAYAIAYVEVEPEPPDYPPDPVEDPDPGKEK